METLFVVLLAYFFIVFVGLRLVVPFMGFEEFRLPRGIPSEIKSKITELEGKSSNQMEYLKLAYNFVTSNWHAGRLDTIWYAPLAFRTNLLEIFTSPGYAHCNTQNYLLFVLLAGSKFFKEQDIKTQVAFFNFFIHQYLKVKVGDRWVNADPAGSSIRGKALGEYISFFG